MTTRPGYVWDATASEWVEIGQAAVVSPFKYQTSQPSSPATGDIWIDSDEDVPSVDSTLYYRWTKTMSGGETSLSGTDNNSLALKYTPGYESVFINGVLQVRGSDYVATTGTTVTGLTALTANDVVMVESIIAYSVGDTYTQSTLDGKFSPITTTGLVLITSATIGTAVSSITVSNVFSATYENYKVIVTNTDGSLVDEGILVKFNNVSGTTYHRTFAYVNNTTGTVTGAAAAGVNTGITVGFCNTSNGSFMFDVFTPFTTTVTNVTGFASQGSGNGLVGCSGQDRYVASQTGFDLIVAGGATLTGGTIKVYGYK